MEPSGVMDSGSLQDITKKTGYNVCDVADEEVHFSIEMLTNQQQFKTNYQLSNTKQTTTSHNNTLAGSVGFTDVNLNNYQHYYHHLHQSAPIASSEQVKSSKLLNSIGSKLRRGTNYLVAPKLVGQYLLGITIQNWSEFFMTSRMMKAPNTHQLTRRLLTNLSYFQGNYLCISLVLVIYCVLTSPLLLLAIIAYLLGLYLVTARSATGRHLKIVGYKPNLQQQYSFITLTSLPLLWVAGAPSAVFWVIGASFVVVGLHASMYSNERPLAELTTHNQHQNNNSLSSYNRASVQYYNHYPVTQHQYIPLQSPPIVRETSSYSNAISQWMMFGGSNGNGGVSGGDGSRTSSSGSQAPRTPDVTIISQDYAGLGRVYEV